MAKAFVAITMEVSMKVIGVMKLNMAKVYSFTYSLGTFRYSNEDRYEGDWKFDKKDGNGSLVVITIRNLIL